MIPHTYILYNYVGMAPIFCNNVEKIERRLYFPGGGDVMVLAFFEGSVRPEVELPQLVEFGYTEII